MRAPSSLYSSARRRARASASSTLVGGLGEHRLHRPHQLDGERVERRVAAGERRARHRRRDRPAIIAARRTRAARRFAARATASSSTPSSAPWRSSPKSEPAQEVLFVARSRAQTARESTARALAADALARRPATARRTPRPRRERPASARRPAARPTPSAIGRVSDADASLPSGTRQERRRRSRSRPARAARSSSASRLTLSSRPLTAPDAGRCRNQPGEKHRPLFLDRFADLFDGLADLAARPLPTVACVLPASSSAAPSSVQLGLSVRSPTACFVLPLTSAPCP